VPRLSGFVGYSGRGVLVREPGLLPALVLMSDGVWCFNAFVSELKRCGSPFPKVAASWIDGVCLVLGVFSTVGDPGGTMSQKKFIFWVSASSAIN
jgi:hypothetical protein